MCNLLGFIQYFIDKTIDIQYGFLIQPQDTTTYSGSNIVLRCNPRLSQPPAVITWFYNGEMLDISSDDRMSLAPSGNLYITNVNASHSGSYRCTASNTVSGAVRRSDEALLIVQGKHSWLYL